MANDTRVLFLVTYSGMLWHYGRGVRSWIDATDRVWRRDLLDRPSKISLSTTVPSVGTTSWSFVSLI